MNSKKWLSTLTVTFPLLIASNALASDNRCTVNITDNEWTQPKVAKKLTKALNDRGFSVRVIQNNGVSVDPLKNYLKAGEYALFQGSGSSHSGSGGNSCETDFELDQLVDQVPKPGSVFATQQILFDRVEGNTDECGNVVADGIKDHPNFPICNEDGVLGRDVYKNGSECYAEDSTDRVSCKRNKQIQNENITIPAN